MRARALMYHDVVADDGGRGGFDGEGPEVYAVTAAGFRAQLDAIAAAVDDAPARAADLLPPAAVRAAEPWLITFDDGGASAVVAGEQLARRGWSGHFFVVTDLVGTSGFVGWDDLRALAAQGHTIGSHTCTHPDRLSACPPERLRDEWARSAAAIADAIGAPTLCASVPGGYYSPAVGAAAAAAGIRALFTSEPVAAARPADGCLLVGRYAVRRSTTPSQAAAAAAGDPRPWARQRAAWTGRAVVKRATGRHYRRLRAALLARRSA
jgi:peptidoglycan/xylan/chitin deacetylase (PgdA/CDA1 family)